MKTKFKEILKKIKYWLSSLCKWAKNHSLKIFMLFADILLLLGLVFSCHVDNKKSASAQSLNVSSPVFVVPNLTLNFANYGQCTTLPVFVGVIDGIPVCYRPRTSGVYESRRFYYFNTEGNITNYYITDYEFLGYRYSVKNSSLLREYIDLNFDNINGDVYFGYDNTIFNDITECLNYSVNSASLLNIGIYPDNNGRYEITFYVNEMIGNEHKLLFKVVFQYMRPVLDLSGFDLHTVPLFVSSNVSLEFVSQELLNQSYSDGYSQGFYEGNLEGYNDGFNAGVEYSTDPTHFEPFYILTRGVSNFLNMQVLGSISLGTLLSIGLGCILFGFAIKIFLGG